MKKKPQTSSRYLQFRNSLHLRLPTFSQITHALRNFVTENTGLKLLSLLLAVAFFTISRQPLSEVTLVSVPLEFHGPRAGLEISGDVPQTVSVRLRGPQDVIRNTTASQIGVVADLNNKEPGERVVQLKRTDVSRPDNLEVLRIEPASIRLHIEQTVQKQVPVEPQYVGEVAAGYERRGFIAQPPTIEISGPLSHLGNITRALTESIQLDGRKESFKTRVDVDLKDPTIRVNTPGPITVMVEIGEKKSSQH
ncbi:MAG TPA: CdaR family protein [Blastocatellia bacterium]|nr:CdaR family protein [Blastocatellia bacterium]